MKRGVFIVILALCAVLAVGSTAIGGAPTGPIPMYAQFRDNCRPTVSPRDCLLGHPQTPDRVGGDFEGGYTDRVAGVESVIGREGNYHFRTNGYGPTSLRHLWLDLSEGSGTRPFVYNYAQDASFTTGGTVPLYEMKVSTEKEPIPYVGTLAIEFGMAYATETWKGMLLFDKVTITRLDQDMWTISASGDKNVKVTDRDRQVMGTYAMPFSLTVKTLPGPPQKP
jgi:hypothetical protein